MIIIILVELMIERHVVSYNYLLIYTLIVQKKAFSKSASLFASAPPFPATVMIIP